MPKLWDYNAVEHEGPIPVPRHLDHDTVRRPGDPDPAEIRRLCFPYRMRKIARGESVFNRPPAPPAIRVVATSPAVRAYLDED